jgi:filamentous hemagglutinin family protein
MDTAKSHGPAPACWAAVLGLGSFLFVPVADANPQGMQVVSGAATAAPKGPVLTLNVSDRALLTWKSFNIAPGEKTVFNQPSPASIVWNQVLDANPSRIFGGIQANGIVVLANEHGFWFGPDSVIKAASFVATTASSPPPDFASSGGWNLNIPPPSASIINYGQIESAQGGSIFLVAEKVENHGVLTAPDGTLGLYAGKEVLVSQRPDGRGLSAKVTLPEGSVDNRGKLIADAGTIAMHAQVVNQNGLAQANALRERNGVIELYASDSVTLGPGSETLARGDSSAVSNGGKITIKSDGSYQDDATAVVSASASPKGGNGGNIDISASYLPSIQAQVDAGASPGFSAGSLTIDPDTITITDSGTGTSSAGSIGAGDPPSQLTIAPAVFSGFSTIALQARTSIQVNTVWSLPEATVPNAKLTLESGGDIIFGPISGIDAGRGWSVSLLAGSLLDGSGAVGSGKGSINVGAGQISSIDGAITLRAGTDIRLKSGFVHTTGGGNISATALSGSINTGTGTEGFAFSAQTGKYAPSASLSGISTAGGGDVSLTAGKDVVSYLPTQADTAPDAGSGAFGAAPGNVTIKAGGGVFGHYVVGNGEGCISAGNSAGAANRQLALSLIKGSWNVTANDVALQEVRNPNAVFSQVANRKNPFNHLIDYDLSDSVTLTAANSINFVGAALPRLSQLNVPIIYPPSLYATAGAGGISLGQSITLFPAPRGQLELSTTDGGSFFSPNISIAPSLIMSDSSATRYTGLGDQFGFSDHSAGLLHLNDPDPIRLNISGDITGITFGFPKRSEISVGGNLVGTGFIWQNLLPGDSTLLAVKGDIENRSNFTFITLPPGVPDPDLSLLDRSVPVVQVPLSYDPKSRTLVIRGRLTDAQRQGLEHLMVQALDSGGGLVTDPIGNPVTVPATLLPNSIIEEMFAATQDVSDFRTPGYQIGGPGHLSISARNIDLGVTKGVVSSGPLANSALLSTSPKGASITINASGNLILYSSAIVSEAGGGITINAGGSIEAGSTVPLPENLIASTVARGIYSTDGTDVSVTADKDVLVNGSRIATYDGGTLSILSKNGNVDAGTGGLGYQKVYKVATDPVTGKVSLIGSVIPGSGILATTFSTGNSIVGDVSITTPNGDIIAHNGGVVQAPFNGTSGRNASVTLKAGTKLPDGTVTFIGKIDASGSGVIGGNVDLEATGDVLGIVLASGNAKIITPQSVSATVVAGGSASVSAGGSVSGTIVGIGSAAVSGGNIEASILSANVTTSGQTSGQVGFAQANVAGATATAAAATSEKKVAAKETETDDSEQKRKKANRPLLARTVGRVTVLLPTKSN